MKRYVCLFLLIYTCLVGWAQSSATVIYINKYVPLAQEQMRRYGIPASITLAQGILESSSGNSYLATKANNHFGIKAGKDWAGPYVLRDDDALNERFRAYKCVEDSYEDHSLFLSKRQRYASLFDLKKNDYKGWAKGLKSAGYATNPRYADILISLIERYDLHQYDVLRHHHGSTSKHSGSEPANACAEPIVRRCNGVYYVVAQEGQTYASIAKWAGLSERKLRRYNEVPRETSLANGEIVYLGKKKTQADKSLKGSRYVLKAGESLHDVAQMYGIKVSALFKNNGLTSAYVPKAGDVLVIRR